MADIFTDDFEIYANGELATTSGGVYVNDSVVTGHMQTVDLGSGVDVYGANGVDGACRLGLWPGSLTAQYAAVVFKLGVTDGIGPLLLSDGAGNYIEGLAVPGDSFYIIEFIGGTPTNTLATLAFFSGPTAGDDLYMEIQGTTITVKQIISGTPHTLGTGVASGAITSGRPGICGFGAAVACSSFRAGDFSGGAPATVPEMDHTQAHRPFNMTSGRR